MENVIEKQIEIVAPLERVWIALTDSRQFGEWFKVKMDGPFVAGQPLGGQITHPGYEHLRMEIVVQSIEPEDALLLYLAPVRYRSEGGLFAGGVYADRVSAAADRGRNFADGDGVRLWEDSSSSQGRGLSAQRWRMGTADEEHSGLCHQNNVTP